LYIPLVKSSCHGRAKVSLVHSLIIGILLAISAQQVMAIPTLVLRQPTAEQKQAVIIALPGRADANAFAGINQLLNAGNYNAAIEKARTILKKYPDSGLANEVLGTAYFLSEQQQKAITPLKKAIKAEPDQSGPLTKLGIIYMETNNLVDAEKLLLQAVQVNPKHRFAHQRLGLLYEYQKKDPLAIQHFYLGLQGTSNDYLGIAVNLGRLLNKSGNYPATVSVLEARVPLSEILPDAQLILATAYLATNNYSKARARFHRVLQMDQTTTEAMLGLAKAQRGEGDLRAALTTIKKLVKLQPKSAQAKLEEGEILLRLGDKKRATAAFDKAVSFGAERSYINQRIARYHLDRKEFTQARNIYQAMVTDRTADAFVFGQLSELLMGQGDIEKGEHVLNQGVKRFPDNAYLHLRYGSYLASIGKYKESLPELKKTTELSPNDATAWKTYAFALSRAGQKSDAVSAAEKLYQLQPNSVETAIFYATRLETNNQLDKAEVIYRKVIKAAPRHALALNNLANILASKKKYNEAEKMAQRAASVANNNANVQDTLGWILYKQGRLPEALDVLAYANKLAPNTAVIWYHQGKVLAKAGKQAEARVAFNKALSLNTSADWVADAKKQLQ